MANLSKYSTEFSIDLRNVNDDQISVSVIPSVQLPNRDTVVFIMPAIVPGTYARYDFGRFITDFHAFCADGSEMETIRKSINEFAIVQTAAQRIHSLKYRLKDSFDDTTKPVIFQPCGTSFQQDTNFLLNFPGVCGYFDGLKLSPIVLTIDKPEFLYAATSLHSQARNAERDIFTAETYDELVDNPIMYSRADTTSYREGNAIISIAVYSMSGKVKATQVAEYIKPLTDAVHQLLGEMPVEHYSFIMYFANPFRGDIVHSAMGTGALEHSYCSVYFLTEMDNSPALASMIQHTGSHEFLHILVPLHLHSREIDDFDFRTPKMSEHLWLYEGATEYFSHLALLKSGLISLDEFRSRMKQKISMSALMSKKPFSLTEFSRNILLEQNQQLYPIIYEKGALSAFILDILLNETTRGKMSLLSLVQNLSAEYGPNKPFDDDKLFDIIGKVSQPAEQYLLHYVDSARELPIEEYFSKIGWNYIPHQTITAYSFGTLKFKPSSDSTALNVVFSFSDNTLKLEENDDVLSLNSKPVTPGAIADVENALTHPSMAQAAIITVKRNGQVLTLTGAPSPKEQQRNYVVEQIPNLTDSQLQLQKWIFGTKTIK